MRLRLRDTIEVFTASNGDTWITHGATKAALVIRDSSPHDRALLAALRGPAVNARELVDRMRAEGHDLTAADAEETLTQLFGLHLLEEPDAARRSGVDAEDLDRYDRQLAYFADLNGQRAAYETQRRLLRARVVILGCGGLGSWTALALLCCGVRHLTLVDDDAVALSNLNRQILYRYADLGATKVTAAREALQRFDPRADVRTYAERVNSAERLAELAEPADIVVATADQPAGTIGEWVNTACMRTGTPWISAGQYPPEVRIGPLYVPGTTACHACAERAARQSHPHYAELSRARSAKPVFAATTGPASGLIGSLLANEIAAFIGAIHTPSTLGHAIAVDLRTLDVTRSSIDRDPACTACGPGTQK
jgi:bacteriocin biosynthesis cyclodehydratase domain-containing protein